MKRVMVFCFLIHECQYYKMKVVSLLIFMLAFAKSQQVASLPQEYQQILQSVSKDEFGKTMLQEVSVYYRTSEVHFDQIRAIDGYLSQLEQQTTQEEAEELEKLQCSSETMTQELEDLKAHLAESQYGVTSYNGEVQSLKDELARIETRIQEKEGILEDYSNIMAEFAKIRENERAVFERNRDDSMGVCNLLKRCRYLIRELVPRNPVLAQQSSELSDPYPTRDVLSQLKQLQEEALETLRAEEPVLKIIGEFVQVANSSEEVLDQRKVNGILDVLQKLYDEIDKTSRVQYNAEDDKADLYKRVQGEVERQNCALGQQVSELKGQKESILNEIEREQREQEEEKQRQESLKQQIADIQKQMEDNKVAINIKKTIYNERSKERKQKLKLIRQIRSVFDDYFDAAECYISQLLSDILNNSN